MIYSKKLNSYIPIQVQSTNENIPHYGKLTVYTVKDGRIPVGSVRILDTQKGVNVNFIKNYYPELYSGFGKIADQIEVEHCLKRNLSEFEINSYASLNSHALHYLRGKRFVNPEHNNMVENVIKRTPKGEQFNTRFLGQIEMFMPKELIKKYIEIIKKSPLLK